MLNLDVSQGQTAVQYPRTQKFQNYLPEVRAKNPLALDSDEIRKILFLLNRLFFIDHRGNIAYIARCVHC